MSHATIIQKVDCIFGHDHKITVEIGDDNTLGRVTTSCSADVEETKGLILLGTDPMKTCLGYMWMFIKHARGEKQFSSYGSDIPHKLYEGTMLFLAAGPIATRVARKKAERNKLQREVEQTELARKSNNLVSTRLQEVMSKYSILGPGPASCFRVLQEDDGHYTFNVALDRQYNYQTSSYDPQKYIAVADRVDGVWEVREDWEHDGDIYRRTGSWGGTCESCGKSGNRGHDGTTGHRKTFVKNMYIGMQATSAPGMKIVLNDIRDEEGEIIEFKYRANQKQFLGVRLPANVKPRPSN